MVLESSGIFGQYKCGNAVVGLVM